MTTQRRDTKQRQTVLAAVMGRSDHPTADEIYAEVRRADEKISRGTVYRNLGLLSEEGQVNHVKVPGADRYDGRLDRHYHILCVRCKTVADVPVPYEDGADTTAENLTGFFVERHRTVFEGLCPKCREIVENGNKSLQKQEK